MNSLGWALKEQKRETTGKEKSVHQIIFLLPTSPSLTVGTETYYGLNNREQNILNVECWVLRNKPKLIAQVPWIGKPALNRDHAQGKKKEDSEEEKKPSCSPELDRTQIWRRGQLGRTKKLSRRNQREETWKQRWRRWRFIERTEENDSSRALSVVSLLDSFICNWNGKPYLNFLTLWSLAINQPCSYKELHVKKALGKGRERKYSFVHSLSGFNNPTLKLSHMFLTTL